MQLVFCGPRPTSCAPPKHRPPDAGREKISRKKLKKGVDFGGKCGIINKLSRKTAGRWKAHFQRCTAEKTIGLALLRHRRNRISRKKKFKKISKKCLTKRTWPDIINELSGRPGATTGPWKLNNTETCGTLNVMENHDKQFQTNK